MPVHATYPHLFSPVTIRGVTLGNRVVMNPTSTALARDRFPTAAQAAFYEARARGGAGLIISEGLRAHWTNCGATSIGMFKPEVVTGLRMIAARVHPHGARLIGQILHGGRQHHRHAPHLLWAPSAVACPYSGYVPHAMTTAEVEAVRDSFVTAAARLREAAWDGVEVHGAQGHLVQEFLSPLTNRRADRYGGDFERRLTFALEVMRGIRAECGADFIVGFRLATSEFVDGGLSLDDAVRMAQALEAHADIDYLALSQSNFTSIAAHIPDRHTPPHLYSDHAQRVRAALSRTPVIATARIRTPDEAEALLADGCADLVGLSRPLICDPAWARKAQHGAAATIRRCIYCNVCWHSITTGGAITCVHNPSAGREAELGEVERAPVARHVVVVGGGPAGLAAAEAAALGGHEVTLLEKSAQLGGQVAHAARIPGDHELANVIDYLAGQLARLGVTVRLGSNASAEDIAAMDADVVIVATGSRLDRANLPDGGAIAVFSAFDVWKAVSAPHGGAPKRAVLLDADGHFASFAIAEYLAQHRIQVYFVTRHLAVGHDIPAASLTEMIGRLDAGDAVFFPAHWLRRCEGRSAVLQHVYSRREKRIEAIDAIVVVGGHRAQDDLYHALCAMQPRAQIKLVGDAMAPRSIHDAVHEGHAAGRSI